MISTAVIFSALELGFIYALVALALFLSFRVLNIADMTTDGSFTLGCAVSATVALAGHPYLALPAAMLATQLHPALGLVYRLLMGLGMFAAALSTVIALCNQAALHVPMVEKKRKAALCTFLLASYVLSLLGFSDLVSIVYPFFGYISVPFMALLVWNWWKQRKN